MDWKVSKEVVEVKPHTNADSLEVLKVGQMQLVAGKGAYETGDVVVVIPEKSVIPKDSPIYAEFEKYLVGPEKDRVKGIRLRGEPSEAITWPLDRFGSVVVGEYEGPERWWQNRNAVEEAAIGEDISGRLGITKYEPPIPDEMRGQVEKLDVPSTALVKHDCYQFAAYADQLSPEAEVVVTEKIHGSQLNYVFYEGEESVSSKGILGRELRIREAPNNVYWRAVRRSGLREIAGAITMSPGPSVVQMIGEVAPVQKGFDYGLSGDEKAALVFELVLDGVPVSFDDLPPEVRDLWVPVLYRGPFEEADLPKLAKGREAVSGEERHIREGVVVSPADPTKRAEDGTRLRLKVLNPKYKDDDEEVN